MSIVAICAASDVGSINAALEAQGFGERNFTVPVHDGGVRASHATLHAWPILDFLTALQGIAGVTVTDSTSGEPRERVQALIDSESLAWPGNAPELPSEGTVSAGAYYRFDESIWLVIQEFDRSTFGDHPSAYPALIRRARVPGQAEPWVQPIDEFDAYLLVDPFTGQAERATHDGRLWEVSEGDGAGLNIWEPGEFGWVDVGPA